MTILNIDTLSLMIITNICQGQHLVAGQKGRYKRSDMYLVTYLMSNRDIPYKRITYSTSDYHSYFSNSSNVRCRRDKNIRFKLLLT